VGVQAPTIREDTYPAVLAAIGSTRGFGHTARPRAAASGARTSVSSAPLHSPIAPSVRAHWRVMRSSYGIARHQEGLRSLPDIPHSRRRLEGCGPVHPLHLRGDPFQSPGEIEPRSSRDRAEIEPNPVAILAEPGPDRAGFYPRPSRDLAEIQTEPRSGPALPRLSPARAELTTRSRRRRWRGAAASSSRPTSRASSAASEDGSAAGARRQVCSPARTPTGPCTRNADLPSQDVES
jgi:hypothetical protein